MLLRPRPRKVPKITTRCTFTPSHRSYASAAVAPAPSFEYSHDNPMPIQRYPPTQPPSYKPPFLRKSQLHRQYASLLRSTPLMLFFQHNNLRASEWAGIRRELAQALRKASATPESAITTDTLHADPADAIRLQIIQTGIFGAALRVVEFYNPQSTASGDGTTPIHASQQDTTTFSHGLSQEAYNAIRPAASSKANPYSRTAHLKRSTPLHHLLHGPLAVVAFPSVTPVTLATALSILAPTPGASSAFPAPRRRDTPGYYEPAVQSGLQKLMLLGARVEGKAMDQEGVRYVGKLPGLEGLQAQLVGLLTGVGMGVTGALERSTRSLWMSLEGRRMMMEEEEKGTSTEVAPSETKP